MKALTHTGMLALALSVTACGGGGGGGGATPPPTSAALTSSNQTIAAEDATSAAFLPLITSQTIVGAAATDEKALFVFANKQLDRLPAYIQNARAASAVAGAVASESYACTYGGTLQVTVNDADDNGIVSAGDSFTLTLSNCQEAEGTLNGSLGLSFDGLTGTYGTMPYGATATMSFGNLSLAGSQFSTSINGSLTAGFTRSSTYAFTESLSTPSLTVTGTYGGVSRTRSLTNYAASATGTPDTTYGHVTSYSASGTLSSTGLASQVIGISTPTAFVARGSDQYPSTGVLLISGANNSSVRVTALSNTQCAIALDENGDGTYEGDTTVNWNTLL